MRIRMLRSWLFGLAGVAAALFTLGTAQAATLYGTPAWTDKPLAMRAGPGGAYGVTGNVGGKLHILVYRCTQGWCRIKTDAGFGWVGQRHLSFGRFPGNSFTNGVPSMPSSGPGSACFYTGANFTGSYSCTGPGYVANDLALSGSDNTIASIRLTGDVSVAVCRDFDFSSYCERIVTSKPHLGPFLTKSISSLHVY
jgi:uncharacterized protein YraI